MTRVTPGWMLALLSLGLSLPALGQAGPGAELLLVDVVVNGLLLDEVVRIEQQPSGPLLLPLDAWRAARLQPLARAGTQRDGTPAYALDAVPGSTWQIDRQRLRLVISAPASAFVGGSYAPPAQVEPAPSRPQPGLMLHYDLTASHSGAGTTSGATWELVAFSGWGNLVTSALLNDLGQPRKAIRLDSYWRYDRPDRLQTLVVGDTVGTGGSWSQPARYGGIRWGSDFSLRSGFMSLPQLSLAGEAALPSTVEVLVNNARRLSQAVQPGPFDLVDVPVGTGAGEIDMVVRDLLGRELRVRQRYYMSPSLLAPGLHEFSLEAGRLRRGYGRDGAYGDRFAAGTWRQGLNSALTGEARVELQPHRMAAGGELAGVLGHWVALRAALATSSGDAQGVAESGHLLRAGIERISAEGGGTLQLEHASRGFAPFAESVGPAAAGQRGRTRWLAAADGRLWGAVSGGVNLVHQTRWDGDRVQMLGLSLGLPLWRDATMGLSGNWRLDGDRPWRAMAAVHFPLGKGIHGSSQADVGSAARPSGAVSAMRNAPAGPGMGWRVQAAGPDSARAQGGVQVNTSQAEWTLDAATDAAGRLSGRAGGRGTVGWLDDLVFASRPAGQGSVAVVRIDGVAGVPVQRSHQTVAVTDARGLAFVPGLQPWQKNQIGINIEDLPLDVTVAAPTREVTPFARSGVVVDFAPRRTRQALLVLQRQDGTPVPSGARVRLLPDGPEFSAGRRGEVWLTDLAEQHQRVQVAWPLDGCLLTLQVAPTSQDGLPGRIGPLVCTGGAAAAPVQAGSMAAEGRP